MKAKNVHGALLVAILVSVAALFSTRAAFAGTSATAGVVNINTASVEQLELLPGIGPGKAKAIFDHRVQHPFASADDLRKVKGISPKLMERIRSQVTVSGETTAKTPAKKARRPRK